MLITLIIVFSPAAWYVAREVNYKKSAQIANKSGHLLQKRKGELSVLSVRPSLQLSFFHLRTWLWVLNSRERRGSFHSKKNSCYGNSQWPKVRIWERGRQGEWANMSQGGFSCWQIQVDSCQGNQVSKIRGKQNIHQQWDFSTHKVSIPKHTYTCTLFTGGHWGPSLHTH